ncbi:N-terminal amidase [Colletotrichum sojae]|uniref:N-terminal amidase n=1 Tax=Colletotrichum sojae TaxID=2175907 RepID=A0A8H6JUS9_9PEZI|nr:N-terminal amidase [Colletotrichum sojae]
MRIGCLQFAPQVADVDNNLNRADSVLSKANPEDLDLLVLPELAFSGYNFRSLQDISPFLEPSGSGITSLWARTTALKYNCNVVAGYPEKADVSGSWPTGPEYYNSAIVVNEEGETIANYRKSFLYYTDETWALEGDGFFDGFIPGLGNTSIGICKSLSPYKFQAPWHAFEFGFHILENDSNLVIVSMAWMTREDASMFSRMPNEPDMDTLTYWVARLEPLIRAESGEEIIIVFCNRTGTEDDVVYAGTSAVIGVQDGEVRIYGILGRGEKELLVVDTSNPPYAKLVYRPEAEKPSIARPESQQAFSPTGNSTESSSSSQGDRSKQSFGSETSAQPPSNPEGSTTKRSLRNSPEKKPGADLARSRPRIQIPTQNTRFGSVSKDRPALSPGSESVNLPTPTAPSPTPLSSRPKLTIPQSPPQTEWTASPVPQSGQSNRSIRSVLSAKSIAPPKLIIPQSPPLAPWQYENPAPLSGRSVQSVRSVDSYQSVCSNGTVTSNRRPPEDSTPYPRSGLPLSGYPTGFRNKRVCDNSVSLNQVPFTPITPFDDVSPTEPRYFWGSAANVLKPDTHATAAGPEIRPAAADTDIRALSFANLKLISEKETPSRPHSSNSARTAATAGTAREHTPVTSNGQKRDASEARRNRSFSRGRVMDSTRAAEAFAAQSSQGEIPARPSSPKSRNASRQRTHERSNSLNHRNHAAAVSQQLESVARRVRSVDLLRSNQSREVQTFSNEQASPSKFHTRRENRTREGLSAAPIATNPSTFRDEAARQEHPASQDKQPAEHSRTRSLSRVSSRVRTGSMTGSERGVRSNTGVPISVEQTPIRSNSRAASRGRQPRPVFSPPRMIPLDPLQPREESREKNWAQFGTKRTGPDAMKQPVTSPSSESATHKKSDTISSSRRGLHRRSSSGPAPHVTSLTAAMHGVSSDIFSGRFNPPLAAITKQQSKMPAVSSAFGNNVLTSPGSFTETAASLPSSSHSPPTPAFEPSTPKAMILIRDDEFPRTGEPPLLDLAATLSDLVCRDRAVDLSPRSSMAVAA